MASRSDYDYSMWPEHARPRRRTISLKLLATVFASGAVCAFAAAAVMTEFAPIPSQTSAQATGRSWPLFSPAEDSRAAGPAPAPPEVASTPATPAVPAVRAASAAPAAPPAAAETTGSASSAARAAKPGPRATRQVALPTIGTSNASDAAPAEPVKAEPAKPVGEQTEAALRKELDAASEETKPAQVDKPKPKKKVRKRVEPAYGTAEVYQYPDGRRVTVIRRPDNPAYGSGYGRPTYEAYPGRPDYYRY